MKYPGIRRFCIFIPNPTNDKKYIGKKLAQFKVTQFKGKKNKRRSTKESDWRDYWGSRDTLNEDVPNIRSENFNEKYCTTALAEVK